MLRPVCSPRRGFHEVGIDDIGAELGISGPAPYHHFRSKDAILGELLVNISEVLLAEGRRRVNEAANAEEALDSLIDWHTRFALENPELITIQTRSLTSLSLPVQEQVRARQRRYVQVWATAIAECTEIPPSTARGYRRPRGLRIAELDSAQLEAPPRWPPCSERCVAAPSRPWLSPLLTAPPDGVSLLAT
jgi:AcrR family transcriptional regulator